MASRTQIVCLCEGAKGRSIDQVFINTLIKGLRPSWIRHEGSNIVRIMSCGNRSDVIKQTPGEIKHCLNRGADTTLMVWADCDDDCADPQALKEVFWNHAQQQEITKEWFERVVFIFAKDRIENWIEFLTKGNTDESKEAPRVRYNRDAIKAAKELARKCSENQPVEEMPPSLKWSCENWRVLVKRMKKS